MSVKSLKAFGWALAAVATAVTLSRCGGKSPAQPTDPNDPLQAPQAAAVINDLRNLQTVTAPFRDFSAAQAGGYTTKVTDCMTDPQGGMGFHYGKGAAIDANVVAAEPEVLLYEPKGGGSLELVGVEYIVPLDAWKGASPPTLYGQTFRRNETFQVWALHAWVWKANPSGVFADWNPRVSCAGAPMSHHAH